MLKRVGFFVLLFVFLGAFVFLIGRKLVINKVRCDTQFGECDQRLSQAIDGIYYKNYFEARRELQASLERNSSVREYELRYVFPSRLDIHIIEEVAEIAVFKDDKYSIFNGKGKLLFEESESNLPIINQDDEIELQKIEFAVTIGREIFFLYGGQKMSMKSDGLYVDIENGPRVIVPLEGDIDALLGGISLTLSQLNASGGQIRIDSEEIVVGEIDFRSRNPVIR